jgi:2'-5' RNA ligase
MVAALNTRHISALKAAFCLTSSHRQHSRPLVRVAASSKNNDGNEPRSNQPLIDPKTQAPSPEDQKDWFVDGRETARRLKMELGLLSDDEENNMALADGEDGVTNSSLDMTSSRSDALESGRQAALNFLESLNDDEEEEVKMSANGSNILLDDETIEQSSNNFQQFTYPARKSHCLTICLVPPPSATNAWDRLTDARRECKDPGFFRWPPHANLIYPFLEPISKEEQLAEFRTQLSISLKSVASHCRPFDVVIDEFGTFGGKSSGVLWAHPKSKYPFGDCDDDMDEEPLITLQKILENHFPDCTDQRKQGSFTPHITISHYANITDALEAKGRIEKNWVTTSFHVGEIYLLQRKGDDGQFKILASIPLGLDDGDDVIINDDPEAFPGMPEYEEEWVLNERMNMKNRRKKNQKRRRKGGTQPNDND